MKRALLHRLCGMAGAVAMAFPVFVVAAESPAAENPDAAFFKTAAEGGLAEVQLGQLAQDKSPTPSVQAFGLMMMTDHAVANDKLKTIAESKDIDLPTTPSAGQMATQGKLSGLTGGAFDKYYIKDMLSDHHEAIKAFQKEASSGRDPDAKAFAAATLPTLKVHLKKIRTMTAAQG